MAKRIIIYNIINDYGGPIVLSALCKTFRELGYDARVMFTNHFRTQQSSALWNTYIVWRYLIRNFIYHYLIMIFPHSEYLKRRQFPQKTVTAMEGIKIQYNPFFNRKNTIVIYPEILYGNPLFATNVVRWLLYFNRYKNQPKAYNHNDMFVCFREIFNDKQLNPQKITLTVNYFDKELYHRYNYGKRSGNCYILRKGRNRPDIPKEFDGPVYDDNMSQEDLVRMFNTHKYCYFYDTQTFYTAIACVCGCIPIVVMEPGKRIEDYLGSAERDHFGVAYGDSAEQIEYAIQTRNRRINQLEFDERNKKNVLAFLPILESRFGKIKTL